MDNCYLEIAIDIPSYLDCAVFIPKVNCVTSCPDTVVGYVRIVLCLLDFTSERTPWTRRGFASPIRTYQQNLSKMRELNDPNCSVTNLCTLGVVDLDLSLCPDVFGLKAFDEKMPITRMLPGSSHANLDYSSQILRLERTVFTM